MTRKAWDHGGKTAKERGYGYKHQLQRKELLAREPLCRMCKEKGRVTPATIADHIVPIAQGGKTYDMDNLQPVCADCHQDKTARDNRWRVKPRISVSGWPE